LNLVNVTVEALIILVFISAIANLRIAHLFGLGRDWDKVMPEVWLAQLMKLFVNENTWFQTTTYVSLSCLISRIEISTPNEHITLP
jgi:hypothetical protein